MSSGNFEWNETKISKIRKKHGVTFHEAQHAFMDENRIITEDLSHSKDEKRFYCFALNLERNGILMVRFTHQANCIRIFGASY